MVTDAVDRVATRVGMPAQAVAILMIVFGLLIIVLPALLPWLIGILLIILGVLWLVASSGHMPRLGGDAQSDQPPPRV